jgi:hypothetical protein
LSKVLQGLSREGSNLWALEMARTAASDWISGSESQPLAAVAVASLSAAVEATAYLGVLSTRDPERLTGAPLRDFPKSAVMSAVACIERELRQNAPLRVLAEQFDSPRYQVTSALVGAAEQLLAAGFVPEVRCLTDKWSPQLPRYSSDWSIRDFLRWNSLKEASGGDKFDPSKYQAPMQSEGTEDEQIRETERLRDIMGAIYPALRVRANAWAGRDPASIPANVHDALSDCVVNMRPGGVAPGISPLIAACWLLEATLCVGPRQETLVEEIVNAVARNLQEAADASEAFLSDVLSRDQRYLTVADRLIRTELQRCAPPAVRASEAVGRLLDLYFAANRVDGALARTLIERARDVAGKADSLATDRAAALEMVTETVCQRAEADVPDASILDRLCALVTYWREIDPESVSPGWALQLLAGRDIPAAVDRAWALDEAALYHIFDGTIAIAAGSLRAGAIMAADVWPLLAVERDSPQWIKFAKRVIGELARARDPALGPAFSTAGLAIRRQIAREDSGRAGRLRDFLMWSETLGLGSMAEAARIRAILDTVEAGTAKDTPGITLPEHTLPHEDPPNFLRESIRLLSSRPRDALTRLCSASASELSTAKECDLIPLVTQLRDSLPVGDLTVIAEVLERWGGSTRLAREAAIITLNTLLTSSSGHPVQVSPEIRNAIRDSISRLIDPDMLAYASSPYFRDLSNAIFEGAWADARERRSVLLRRAAPYLEHLDASSTFRLAARIGALLDDAGMLRVACAMIQETFDKAPITYTAATLGRDSRRAIPHLLALSLRHPRLDVRWHALYCVAHGLCDVDETLAPRNAREATTDATRNLLSGLLDEFADESKLCWATTREWLSCGFEHVARRTPWVLSPAAGLLLPHALSREFPHVKIREHLRNALLSLHSLGAVALKPAEISALNAINRPIERADKNVSIKVQWQQGRETAGAFEVSPHDWDTVHYWYDDMLECFAGDAAYLKAGALAATKHWAAHLGVTESMVRDEITRTRNRYSWQETANDHGSEPQIELLDKYVARHALYLVAGKLMDQIPTAKGMYNDDRWNDFLRYRARGGDPELTGRWIDAPPPAPENYEIFTAPPLEWQQKRPSGDFLGELTSGVSEGWIVLTGQRSISAWDRRLTTYVNAALVDRRTASSLGRVLEDPNSDRYATLSFWQAHYDCTVQEAEQECRRTGSALASLEQIDSLEAVQNGDDKIYEQRFYLTPVEIAFHQELPLQQTDPFRRGSSENYSLPAPEVVTALGWTRLFGRPEWIDTRGRVVARHEEWSNVQRKRWSYGHRLIIRIEALRELLQVVGTNRAPIDLIWSVRISRDVLSAGERVGDIDLGTRRAFLWSRIPEVGATGPGDIAGGASVPKRESYPQP